MTKRQQQAKTIRIVRKIHRTMGIMLFVLFLVVAISGLTLGWKKNSKGFILPKSYVGTSTDLKDWLPLDTLQQIAFKTMQDSIDPNISLELQRIDARPGKGMIKFVFDKHYWGVQLDGATGKILKVTRRNHDLVENIHDGSIIDIIFETEGEIIKLFYTSTMGLALLTFVVTGFWLWAGPKRMRHN